MTANKLKNLKQQLTLLTQEALNFAKAEKMNELQNCFSELCELHKNEVSENHHREIRAKRDELKKILSKELDKKQWESLEEDIAEQELQAEAVAFVKSIDEFLSSDPLPSDLQKHMGVGLELSDAINRLGLPLKGLLDQLEASTQRLLAEQVRHRLEELVEEQKWKQAFSVLQEFDSLVGEGYAKEFFGKLRTQIEKKVS